MRTELQTELQEIKQLLLLNNKTVLTPDEVSLMYGLSKDYLYHLTSERVIPFHKPNGKKIFFDKEEVENWLLQNRQDTVWKIQCKLPPKTKAILPPCAKIILPP